MVNVLLFLGGLAILLVSSRQVFLMFREGSFRARGNRLIVRNAHPIIFWMNFVGLVLFGIVGSPDLLAIAYLSVPLSHVVINSCCCFRSAAPTGAAYVILLLLVRPRPPTMVPGPLLFSRALAASP